MASHEIRVRMGQKNVPQFEPILSEIIQIPLYIAFWIDYNSFASRCDDVRSVRESRNKKSLNMHRTSIRTMRPSSPSKRCRNTYAQALERFDCRPSSERARVSGLKRMVSTFRLGAMLYREIRLSGSECDRAGRALLPGLFDGSG